MNRRRLQTPRRNSLVWPTSLETAQLLGLPTLYEIGASPWQEDLALLQERARLQQLLEAERDQVQQLLARKDRYRPTPCIFLEQLKGVQRLLY